MREEPSMSKEDKLLREDRDAMMQMGRFELKAFAKRIQIDITGCVNHEDFVERIVVATMYPEVMEQAGPNFKGYDTRARDIQNSFWDPNDPFKPEPGCT